MNHGYLSKRFSNCTQAYKTNKTKIKFLSHKLRTNRARETQIELQYLMMPSNITENPLINVIICSSN
jgi:hypothetical protein